MVYPNHPLPPGCNPAEGRLGVEGRADTVVLYVQRGVRYLGTDPEVAEWLTRGAVSFPDVATLIAWLDAKTQTRLPLDGTQSRIIGSAGDLTDLDSIPDVDSSVHIDSRELLERLTSQVVGQTPALTTVATTVATHVAKRRPRRPVTVMLLGPTGSGKTMTATTLAQMLRELTGHPWPLVRLDMAEFSEPHSVSRLHGAPPGYVGYQDGLNLTTSLRAEPQAIVLFDEIEKAHPSVHRAIMNLLDAGRLGGSGASVDATRCIMLFTSNMAAEEFADIPHDEASVDARGRALLIARGMPPEIVGRITRLCVFSKPTSRQQAEIAAHALLHVADDYGVSVAWVDPAYLTDVLRRLRDNRIGARGLEYLIEADLGQQLAAVTAGSAVRVDQAEAGPVLSLATIEPSAESRGPDIGRQPLSPQSERR